MLEIIGSLVGGFFLGMLGNILTQRYVRASAQQKRERFRDVLETRLQEYRERSPDTDAEPETRRAVVKRTVKELSQEIFGKPVPDALTLRGEDTKYPPVDCKWCWEQVHPRDGAEGRCKYCALPLCYWIDRNEPPVRREPPKLSVAS